AASLSVLLYSYLHCSADRRDLPSFPTRRSSDLGDPARERARRREQQRRRPETDRIRRLEPVEERPDHGPPEQHSAHAQDQTEPRSEEHTSELQSRENLVCRLLLEKKKVVHASGR